MEDREPYITGGNKMKNKYRAWGHLPGENYRMHDSFWLSPLMIPGVDGGPICDHTLMQYTGLKDKNGKEIYEGDVVVVQGYIDRLALIRWRDGGFETFEQFGPCIGHVGIASKCFMNCSEIIGNIYENPELLK